MESEQDFPRRALINQLVCCCLLFVAVLSMLLALVCANVTVSQNAYQGVFIAAIISMVISDISCFALLLQ
jgi:hypothetical protein